MSDEEDISLLAIDLGPDNYASTAATDTPTHNPRTHQTEAAFAQIKSSYIAKQDTSQAELYADLIRTAPALDPAREEVGLQGEGRVKLNKREQQLLGYVVGELYWDREFERIVDLCDRVFGVCVVDKRLGLSLGKWRSRAMERLPQPEDS